MNTPLLIKSRTFWSKVHGFFLLVCDSLPADLCDNALHFVFLADGIFCEDTFTDAASVVTGTAADAVFFD